VFRADNRVVLTYLPDGPAADDQSLDEPDEEAAA
jgi:hypothetical protein